MYVLALGKSCLLDGGFRVKIVQLILTGIAELKAAFLVPASTLNFVWIVEGILQSSSNYVTAYQVDV